MKCKKILLSIFMIVILSCAGCKGSSKAPELEAAYGTKDSETEGSEAADSETEKILLQPHQWRQGFLEKASMSSQEKPYYDMRRLDIRQPEMDFSYVERKDVAAYAWDARYVL
ncbi:MAG: hypothetical protein J1E01_09945, partial [Acetatifactor sp.]|nr:hypothetical protein [Acetatifactor sp.]